MGFDGRSKGGVGLVIGGAHATLLQCTLEGNAAELGGAFYVQGCDESRSREALCDAALAASGGTRLFLPISPCISLYLPVSPCATRRSRRAAARACSKP